MTSAHPGATMTPGFREFLPSWIARQSWYLGDGVPRLRLVGTLRFEDPEGVVGVETHLVDDGSRLYQVPMTFRGAPLESPDAEAALISESEHSVLGTRWIYDAMFDPVWRLLILELVGGEGIADSGTATAVGRRIGSHPLDGASIDVVRVLAEGEADFGPEVVGRVHGAWYPDGPDGREAAGSLAVLQR